MKRAEIFKIDIEFTLNQENLVKIPELIEVPKGSIIQWNIKNFGESYYHRPNSSFMSLIFTLYFDNKSPFKWKRTFIQILDFPFKSSYLDTIRLAEDIVGKKGDYKYGFNVFDPVQNETIYDEDPILRVF